MCRRGRDYAQASAPQGLSDADIEACVANLRTLLEMRMDAYFKESQGLDELAGGLSLPVETVKEMTYREICRHIADRVSTLEVSGSVIGTVIWPLMEPYRCEHDRPRTPVPASYPFITYYMAIEKLYGEDDTLMEALFNGLVESGCGSVIPLHKYLHILRGMKCIPREEIIYDLLVRPFLWPLVETG